MTPAEFQAVCRDGSDGFLDGVRTVGDMVPVGGVYTLTRDVYLTGIGEGVTVRVNGYRLMVNCDAPVDQCIVVEDKQP